MDIMIEGTGKRYYKPDEVKISLDFYTKKISYESALEKGTRDVQIFIKKILEKMDFSKEDLKTKSFKVYEETKYDDYKREVVNNGFAYKQEATLRFAYEINTVAEFMERVSRLENPPKYRISFDIKNKQQSKNEVMSDAYNNAKEKAQAIAKSAGKALKECVKVDFRPFEEKIYSGSTVGSANFDFSFNTNDSSTQNTITNIFIPEDIEISETLYCLWTTD